MGWLPLVASSSESTVLIDVFNAMGIGQNQTTSGGQFLVPGSGSNGTSNMVMLVGVGFVNVSSGVDTSPTITWDPDGTPQSMSLLNTYTIVGSPSNSDVYFFGLVNPNQGSKKINVNWTGTNASGLLFGLTAVNADQTGGTTTFTNFSTNSGTGTTASVSNTAPSTRLTMATFEIPTTFTTGNGTSIGVQNTANISAIAAEFGTAISPLTYTAGSSGAWLANSISIKGH